MAGRKKWVRELPLHILMIPGVIAVFIFNYIPMFGIIMAFQKFVPAKGFFGSKWVGMDNFRYIFSMPNIWTVIRNTVFIAVMKIIANLIVPIIFALLLNEIRKEAFKRTIQTIIYFPHFLSWVILGGILIDVLSPTSGIVNEFLGLFGVKPVYFLGDAKWFPFTLVLTNTWKEFGYNTIVYLAALTSIDPTLYEAAVVDGAGRLKQTWHITLPGILPIVTLMTVLSLGNVLNAGFDQVFNLYSPSVYSTGDIIDTLVYRIGMVEAQFSVSAAVGLFKSAISFVLVVISNKLANKYAGYRVF
ncbi:putative multiple-sugar transport system permease YteP [Thermoclostridium stercorarium subsp. stercorarium DSM 8532]|jgi:putative aldouronate transport system permease protein|uniref:Protein lplB n=3 Tax=Thermoclostridium stercorarium TaxID=1510 RepID=A0A1B1YIC0_THEST|nr:ABC transporter permease subunit [Thermoclostridium stercorarium]AGC67518.1 putative multiple-sugar transport system permease YteP [Thermoclostridium stercorarium subsp. stercorarium DSM 8532]AGI38571.1 ABC transporter permease subunit [Thermoclostridium stercorarium subsp. stercorarium DSM 8532]ANW97944.1 protein lplB [Thermoclostridium stercorarium subsp. thermolacticum DSM 2910]ANX00494.1 protein lplB [Thermoclostridium stercorarium subsp. leptospartum DSM 9219]UZQ86104.1 ABC transporter